MVLDLYQTNVQTYFQKLTLSGRQILHAKGQDVDEEDSILDPALLQSLLAPSVNVNMSSTLKSNLGLTCRKITVAVCFERAG